MGGSSSPCLLRDPTARLSPRANSNSSPPARAVHDPVWARPHRCDVRAPWQGTVSRCLAPLPWLPPWRCCQCLGPQLHLLPPSRARSVQLITQISCSKINNISFRGYSLGDVCIDVPTIGGWRHRGAVGQQQRSA